jgi:hypothetical protein
VFEIVLRGGKEPTPSWKIATGAAMSLSRCSPRSEREMPSARRSRVARERITWPPCEEAATRAAKWTSSPT